MSCSVSSRLSLSTLYSETLRPPFTLRVWSTLNSLSLPPNTRFLPLVVSLSTSICLAFCIYLFILHLLLASSSPFTLFVSPVSLLHLSLFTATIYSYFSYSVAHMLSTYSNILIWCWNRSLAVSPFYLPPFFAIHRDKLTDAALLIDTVEVVNNWQK